MEGTGNVSGEGELCNLRNQERHLGGDVSGALNEVPECCSGNEVVGVFFPGEDRVGARWLLT